MAEGAAVSDTDASRANATARAHSLSWDETFDVVVVGFGGAGAAAALEAHRRGARVLVIDRFLGGGATAQSGGIVYLGGGSAQQKLAGYDDSPEQMLRYLQHEVNGVVSDDTLRRFCDESLDHLHFLEDAGVPMPPRGEAPKTSYPPDDCTLYFSGNELCPPYSESVAPAPRGHRPLGKGLTGNILFHHLRAAVRRAGIDVRLLTAARGLVTDEAGRVCGAVVHELDASALRRARYKTLFAIASAMPIFSRRVSAWASRKLAALERSGGRTYRVRARGGVVLSAGGFVFNREMMARYAPDYRDCMAIGTAGDDGAGIELGRSVGGSIALMDRCGAWRFINPPQSLTRGILVGADGERLCNEELYGATLGRNIAEKGAGRGILVIDERIRKQVVAELVAWKKVNFQSVFAVVNLYVNRKRAHTVEELARACGLPDAALRATVAEYNRRVREGAPDAFGKSAKVRQPLDEPPFYAIRCDLASRLFPTPCFTIGGLRVDEPTGRVLREDGAPIDGLYAAGRTAVGISSHSYVSGLSIADGIFSGRRAALHAAAVAQHASQDGA